MYLVVWLRSLKIAMEIARGVHVWYTHMNVLSLVV